MLEINLKKNGPIVITLATQKVKLVKETGEETLEIKTLALCRCGASKNKPFCDGAHKTLNFEADEGKLIVE